MSDRHPIFGDRPRGCPINDRLHGAGEGRDLGVDKRSCWDLLSVPGIPSGD